MRSLLFVDGRAAHCNNAARRKIPRYATRAGFVRATRVNRSRHVIIERRVHCALQNAARPSDLSVICRTSRILKRRDRILKRTRDKKEDEGKPRGE